MLILWHNKLLQVHAGWQVPFVKITMGPNDLGFLSNFITVRYQNYNQSIIGQRTYDRPRKMEVNHLPWGRHICLPYLTLRWRRHGCDSVSNHLPHDCLLNRLFGRRSKKTSKLRVTGLCVGNSPRTVEFPAQMASNAENVSIWWRHHDTACFLMVTSGPDINSNCAVYT